MAESLKNRAVNGVLWSSLERFVSYGIGFAFGLIIARLLAPSDYGIIAMLNIFMSVSVVFMESGFATALIRKPDRTEADTATTFYFNVVVGIVCYILLFFSAPLIARFYDIPILTNVTRVIGLNLLLGSLCIVQNALLSARLDFKTQAKISFSGNIVSGVVGLYFAYRGYGVWALVIQSVFGTFFRTILLFFFVKWRPRERFSKASFQYLFSFGSKLLASSLLDIIYNNLYTIVIAKKFSAASLGVYARAENLAQFPSSNITGTLQKVTFPVLSTIQNEDERLRVNYRKFLRMSGFVVFPLMIGLAAIADPLIRFLLTEKWVETIPLLQIICFAMMWYPIHAINLNLLQVKGRSDLFLRLEVFKKILGVAILCVTIPMGLATMCVGRVVSSLICLGLNTHYTGKLINLGYWRQMRDLMPTIVNSLITGVLAYSVQFFVDSNLLRLVLGVLVGGGFYILSNILFDTMEWKEFMLIIKRK